MIWLGLLKLYCDYALDSIRVPGVSRSLRDKGKRNLSSMVSNSLRPILTDGVASYSAK